MAKHALLSTLAVSLMVSTACATNQGTETSKEDESRFRQNADEELVEITIRLPDGRVIKRMEPRIASKKDPQIDGSDGALPPVPRNSALSTSQGRVSSTKSGTSGGSNSSSVKTGGGGSAGGGSSSSGGGGGSSTERGSNGSGSGGGGGSSNDIISPVQPDLDFTVRIYAWENSGAPFQNINKSIIVDPRRLTPKQLARSVAQQARSNNSDRVVLRFWKEYINAARDPLDIENPRELINSGGFTSDIAQYWREFAIELKLADVTPDYLIFDMEEGISFWHIPINQRREFFGELLHPDRQHLSALPPSMNRLRVEEFMNYRNPAVSGAFSDYNQFAAEFRASMIRRVFHDAFEDAYGQSIPMSNYGDINTGFAVYSYHNREQEAATVAGISAPVAYLDSREGSPRYARRSKHHRWNRFIDQLNEVRSAAQPGLVTPWIAPPGYGREGRDEWASRNELDREFDLWQLHMQHMLAMGIDTFLLWNPSPRFNPNAITTDAMMDNWLAAHPRVSTPQLRSLPEIPLDADYIETNGVVTTYQDFLEMMNINE